MSVVIKDKCLNFDGNVPLKIFKGNYNYIHMIIPWSKVLKYKFIKWQSHSVPRHSQQIQEYMYKDFIYKCS
jgi:hypothetical protein